MAQHKSYCVLYFTPKSAWENIVDYLPKDKIIYEPFNDVNNPNSLLSSQYLRELGCNVISKPYNPETNENDFFTSDYGDCVISNPPFTLKRKVVNRLYELDKPFILIMPTSTITPQYFNKFKNHLQIIVPKKRINFNYYKNDKKSCSFDTFYYCWKMNLQKDLIFL